MHHKIFLCVFNHLTGRNDLNAAFIEIHEVGRKNQFIALNTVDLGRGDGNKIAFGAYVIGEPHTGHDIQTAFDSI